MLKQKPFNYLLFLLSILLYTAIAYGIERHQTLPLFLCYLSLFLLYIIVLAKQSAFAQQEIEFWILAAIVFRAGLLFSVPALSDDFYRFVWDGRLLAAGYHPFAEVPSYYMNHHLSIPGIDAELYTKLNSKNTFTIYPPVSQLIFWVSVILSNGSTYASVVVMRIILFSFEIGTLWVFAKLILHFKQPPARVLIYALNPLVILEVTGNLHFEGVMTFFLLWGILFLCRNQPKPSAFAYGFSICTKLIPLLFLPALLPHLGWKKAIAYWIWTSVITVLLFLPLLSLEIFQGLSTSLGYYFQRFEFNASIYYLVREAGYLIFGYNIIQFAGPVLAFIATVLILTISFRNLRSGFGGGINGISLFSKMLWCLLIYLLFTTILHPWYIITLLAISVFTPYRFPLVWSGLIFLTYSGYTENSFNENLPLVALEYIVVIAYLFYESIWTKRKNHS